MKYIIIGNGVAGMEAALTLCKINARSEIIIKNI
jgi:protoporphyrinogen oxidase